MVSIVPISETNEWRVSQTIDGASPAYRRCANLNTPAACNWLLADHGVGAKGGLCVACRLNRTIPNLSIPENGVLWGRFEQAKRQIIRCSLWDSGRIKGRISEKDCSSISAQPGERTARVDGP
jgi:hypothetical protein